LINPLPFAWNFNLFAPSQCFIPIKYNPIYPCSAQEANRSNDPYVERHCARLRRAAGAAVGTPLFYPPSQKTPGMSGDECQE